MDIPNTKVRLIWSTPSPLKTYGQEICDMVRDTDNEAVIWDTREKGRPDLVQLAVSETPAIVSVLNARSNDSDFLVQSTTYTGHLERKQSS